MSGYTFEQAVDEHDARKEAVFESVGSRSVPNGVTGRMVLGSTITAGELLDYSNTQAPKMFADLQRAVLAGMNPVDVVAGYIADGILFGERIGRKRTEAGA